MRLVYFCHMEYPRRTVHQPRRCPTEPNQPKGTRPIRNRNGCPFHRASLMRSAPVYRVGTVSALPRPVNALSANLVRERIDAVAPYGVFERATCAKGLGLPVAPPKTKGRFQRPICRAKVVKSEPTRIMVLSPGSLTVGERIVYASLADLEGFDLDQTPPAETWRSGVIWRVDKDCLHLTRT
jgi:hypothetical protein